MFTNNLLLTNIDGSQTNVNQLLDVDSHVVLNPAKVLLLILLGEAREESNGHTVDVSTVADLRSVDIGVSIDPDNSDLAVQTLAGSLGSASDGANGDAVISAKSEGHSALAGVLISRGSDLASDGRGMGRLLHPAVVGVRLGDDVIERLDGLVAVELVAKLIADLGEKTRLDKDGGTIINTVLRLC